MPRPRGVRLLGQLAKDVRRKGAVDGTVYGTNHSSTRSFFTFHLSTIAARIVFADALALDNAAAAHAFMSAHPAGRPLGSA